MNFPGLAQAVAVTPGAVVGPRLWVFFLAFLVTLAVTPLMRHLAIRNGIIDRPDLKRKMHTAPVAYLGGVAIFIGWVAGVVLSPFLYRNSMDPMDLNPLKSILFGAAVITVIGLIDDVYGISPRVKVGGQLIAAAALAGQTVGIRLVHDVLGIVGLSGAPWLVYILGAAVITLFVLGGCNSMNLLDGLDGLAAGVGIISCLGFLFIAVYIAVQPPAQLDPGLSETVRRITLDRFAADQLMGPVRVVMCLSLLGALLGFLPYNFNPATIFMGDAGSLLLGFLCVSIMLLFAHTPASGPKFVTAALIVFSVPITDTSLAIIRRKLRGQPLSSPDSQHLHHQLLRLMKKLKLGHNLTVKLTVFVMYLLSTIFAVLGCAMVIPQWRYTLAVFVVLFGFMIVTAYKVGQGQALATAGHASLAAKPVPGGESRSRDSTTLPPLPKSSR